MALPVSPVCDNRYPVAPPVTPPTVPSSGGGGSGAKGGGNRAAKVMDVTFGNTQTATASHTIPIPSNVVAGELLVAVVMGYNTFQSMNTVTSGWTRRDQAGIGDNQFWAIFTKTAAGSDASLVVTSGASTGYWAHYLFVIDNADTSAPIFDNSMAYSGGTVNTTIEIASLATDSKNDVCLGIFGGVLAAPVITSMTGSGWTDLGQHKSLNFSTSAAYKRANNNSTSGAVTGSVSAADTGNIYGQIIVKASGSKTSSRPRISVYETLAAAESSGDTWTDGQAVYVTGSSGSGAVQFKYFSALDQG